MHSMRRFIMISMVCAVAGTPTLANTSLMRQLGGEHLSFKKLAPGSVLLSVATQGRSAGRVPKTQAMSGDKRPVIVDGVLMELDEAIVRGQIRAGVFILVYPGTNIPWTPGGAPVPSYPPDWLGS